MRSTRALSSLLLIGFLFAPTPADAVVLDYEMFPHVGGRVAVDRIWDMDVVGTMIFAAADAYGLLVADVSDPNAPVEIGRLDTPGETRGVGVFGTHALVGDQGPGLWLVDASTPTSPTIVAAFATLGDTYDIHVEGTLAIVEESVGFEVFDVSTPSAPTIVGSYTASSGNLVVHGSTVYQVSATTGLTIIDVSVPASPAVIGTFNPGGDFGGDLDVAGDYVYVSRLSTEFDCGLIARGFWIVDVSVPASPTMVADEDYGGNDVSIVGSLAFLGSTDCYYSGAFVRIIDVSTPSAPTRVGQFMSNQNLICQRADAGSFYVGDWLGLQVYDGQTLAIPRPLGALDLPDPIGLDAVGSIAYVADRGDGLRIVDLTYPVAPSVVSTFDPGEEALEVLVDGAYAYLSTTNNLVVVDVATPSSPTLAAVVDKLSHFVASSGYLYGARETSFDITDISDPTNPSLAGSLPLNDPRYVVTDGSYAYVREAPSGASPVRVIDVTVPSTPVVVATVDFGENVNVTDLLLDGSTLFVASSDQHGFYVVDVAVPTNPLLLRYERTPGCGVTDLALSNGFLYASPWKGGVDIYDVTTPSSPELVGTAHPGVVRNMTVEGELLLVTEAGRLTVLSRHSPGPLVATPESPTQLHLLRVAPNPASGVTTIRLGGGAVALRAGIFDISGRLVRRFDSIAGDHVVWDGRDDTGLPVAPGVYAVRAWGRDRVREARIVVTR